MTHTPTATRPGSVTSWTTSARPLPAAAARLATTNWACHRSLPSTGRRRSPLHTDPMQITAA